MYTCTYWNDHLYTARQTKVDELQKTASTDIQRRLSLLTCFDKNEEHLQFIKKCTYDCKILNRLSYLVVTHIRSNILAQLFALFMLFYQYYFIQQATYQSVCQSVRPTKLLAIPSIQLFFCYLEVQLKAFYFIFFLHSSKFQSSWT